MNFVSRVAADVCKQINAEKFRTPTSKQMKKEADIYINYVAEFCVLEVEPTFKESDFVHIHDLSKVCTYLLFENLSSKQPN